MWVLLIIMAALSWEGIVERGKQHNKTVICELEKRGKNRYFEVKCNICGEEFRSRVNNFIRCFKCFCKKNTNHNDYFISKSKEIHGDKYNYDFVKYVHSKTKVKILCNSCNNIFEQRPCNHLNGNGCKICFINKLKHNYDYFISESKKIHGDKYNYDFVEYVGIEFKVKILCNKCNNIFEQRPSRHIKGFGCQICVNREITTKNTKSFSDFTNESKEVHGNKYNYDFVEYVNFRTKVKILCNSCNNIFEQIPFNHVRGHGCKTCAIDKNSNAQKSNIKEFIVKAEKIHQQKYNYEFVNYNNCYTKIKILCKKCNKIFEQSPSNHIRGEGCPKCNESKGEIRVAEYLSEKNIRFIPQKTFQTLRDIRFLKCDFYLEDLNLLIEYDGEYHYKLVRGSTSELKQKNLENNQRRDKIKDEWAKANNIPLLRIPYWDFDRIEELIDAFILEHTRKKETKQLVLEM